MEFLLRYLETVREERGHSEPNSSGEEKKAMDETPRKNVSSRKDDSNRKSKKQSAFLEQGSLDNEDFTFTETSSEKQDSFGHVVTTSGCNFAVHYEREFRLIF